MASADEKREEIHKAFFNFAKRAEKTTNEILVNTFVDSAPLFQILSTRNSQVIYGRRGTGKTHALKYLYQHLYENRLKSIYIDLRSIGSDGAIYSDPSRSITERSIRLVLDVLRAIADELYSLAVEKISDAPHPEQLTSKLDDLYNAISDIKLDGNINLEKYEKKNNTISKNNSLDISISSAESASFSAGMKSSGGHSEHMEEQYRVTGTPRSHINFGWVQSSLKNLLIMLDDPDIWVLIDEWSEIPLDLQPHLADLIRRTLLPINNVIIKIAAIEHRSRFSEPISAGEYLGLELGADLSADLNLDDFLVFENDQKKAVDFFKSLLFNHYRSMVEDTEIQSADDLIRMVFTQVTVFDEFVRAVEGVPRDALNLAGKVVGKAYGKTIAVGHVRSAARDWYSQDKAAVIRTDPKLDKILSHLIDKVIGERRARAFLFPSNARSEIIDRLFDSRILHLLKKNVSSHDEPGERYDVFKIDYGCYVDLINTQKAPQGLFEIGDNDYVEVPADDYRSIRRAILRHEDLEAFSTN